jgi:CelD/BcsL family acetyltransferase involved in cellulose biosynthesis
VRLVAGDVSREAFNQLIDWKREQLDRTGATTSCVPTGRAS